MHLVGFIIKKSVTMHGHMNIKIVYLLMLLSFFSINCFENIFLLFRFSAPFIFTTLKKYKTNTRNSVAMRHLSFFHYYYTCSLFYPLLFCSACGQVADWATLMQ